MALQINRPPDETVARIKEAVAAAIDDAEVEATGMGGHFEIRVVSPVFGGKSTLQKHRLVLAAIAPLMKGERAPVHAVDRIEALTPEQAG